MDLITSQVAIDYSLQKKEWFDEWFESIAKQVQLKYQTTLKNSIDHFRDYLTRTYETFSFIRPVGFRDRQNFLDIYIPLTLVNGNTEIRIDGFPVFHKNKHILILDNAGMGKSTVSKRMFIGAFEDGQFGFPFFIKLRHLSRDNDIVKEILSQIGNLSSDFDEELFKKLVKKGGFIFFLDGYDEISATEKKEVTQSIQSFIRIAGNNTFILTSRKDDALTVFQSFDQYSIRPLKKEEAYSLLKKLDHDWENSQKIIEIIKGDYFTISEFLTSPLLVTLLYTALDFRLTILPKKYFFYEQVFDAFFQVHDLQKEAGYERPKKCGLSKDDFAWFLGCLGFISVSNELVDFTESLMRKAIRIAKEKYARLRNMKANFNEDAFLYDVTNTVPFFSHEGLNYKWVHISMAEYFAVTYFIGNTNEKDIVEDLYSRNLLNLNILELYFDMKPFGFRRFLLVPVLDEVKHFLRPEKENKLINILLFYMLFEGVDKLSIDTKRTYKPNFGINDFIPHLHHRKDWTNYQTILRFLSLKNYLIKREKIKIDISLIKNTISNYLKKKQEIILNINDGENVKDKNLLFSILALTMGRSHLIADKKTISFPYLTKEICEEEINAINREMEKWDFYRIM